MLTDPLVTVDWLASHLEDVRVIDGTWSMPNETGDLPNGYIKGAVVFDIDAIADPDSDMAHMLPSAEIFARSVGQMGITLDDTIVIYDRHGVFSAPRVWWTFRMFGHKNVYVLDGGLRAWRDAGHDIAAQPASYAKSFYKVCPASAKVADIDEVLSAASKDIQIIDARPPGRFKGTSAEPRAGLRSGHMPGAINIPFGTLRTPQSRFKPLSDIAQIMQKIDLTAPVITTCGSGLTAAGLAFNLARLGASDVSVYDGSWTEYGGREDVPITPDVPMTLDVQ